MAVYESKIARLSFYVDGQRKQFAQGRYVTDDRAEIKALDGLTDAVRVDKDEPKAEQKAEPKQAEAKPKSTPKAKAKSSDK